MIDVLYESFKIFIDCFMLIFNWPIPFYDNVKIPLGVLAIAFLTLINVVYFTLKSIGIIRKGDE